MPLGPGIRLGVYEIVAPIGSGGMGEVYRARDLKLDRDVAVKVLPASMTSDGDRVRRFISEARIASTLNHPHLVAIHDVGEFEHDGKTAHYIAMELVDGVTLRDQLDRERLPLKKSLLLLAQAADALAAAHHAGIAHRDIKPENILISREGYVKVVDFGLAKLREGGDSVANTDGTEVRGTTPGMVMGTLGYMSPEQAEGKAADHRSDVFSLGCVLYEMVTGRRAFGGSSRVDTLHKIVSAHPEPLSSVAPSAPAQLQWIVRKCLSKDPDARYQSMKDLSIDLRELAADVDSGAVAAPPAERASRRWWAAAALIAILAGAAVIALIWQRPRAVSEKSIEIRRVTEMGNVIGAAISPDGKYLANVTSSQGKQGLWLQQIGTQQAMPIRPEEPGSFWGHAFSPDGASIYYAHRSEEYPTGALFRVATLGGAPVKILESLDSTVAFSPDGKRIAFVRPNFPTPQESALLTANSDGGDVRVVMKAREPLFVSEIFFSGPAWSPDGKQIAFVMRRSDIEGSARVMVIAADGRGLPKTFGPAWARVGQVAWMPDGNRLLAVAGDASSTRSQIWEIPLSGQPRPITRDLFSYRMVSLSADGRTLVTVASDSQAAIWSAPMAGGETRRLTHGKYDGIGGVAALPGGRMIYTLNTSNAWVDLAIASADGSNPQPLFGKPSTRRGPAVSRDGKYVAYIVAPQAASRIQDYVNTSVARARIDGSDERILAPAIVGQLSFTPDGQAIVFTMRHNGRTVLARIGVNGGSPHVLTTFEAFVPSVSPDGTQIACLCEQPRSLCILPISGGNPVKRFPIGADLNYGIHWMPDGKTLLVFGGSRDRANVYRQALNGSPLVKVTNFSDQNIFDFAPTPDGQSLLISRVNLQRDAVMITGF